MRDVRHSMLWIDLRTGRAAPSARADAEAAFHVIDPPEAAERARMPPCAALPNVVAFEIDPGPVERLPAIRQAMLDALRALPAARPQPPIGRRTRTTAPAVAYIEDNLAGHVSLEAAARACRLSSCELSRRFHQEYRETFSAYVLRRRIERARALLEAGRRPVSQVAYAVGFNDLSYFARVFRRIVGMRASEYLTRRDAAAGGPSAA